MIPPQNTDHDPDNDLPILTDSLKNPHNADRYLAVTIPSESYGGTTEGDSAYEEGETVTLTAKPQPGYRFAGWVDIKSDGSGVVSTANPYTFAMPASHVSLMARFEEDTSLPDEQRVHHLTVAPQRDADGKELALGAAKVEGAIARGGYLDANYTMARGNTITLTAKAYDPSRTVFVGWYDFAGKLICADPVWQFTAERALELIPTFAARPATSVPVYLNAQGGYREGEAWVYTDADGRLERLPAPTKAGYDFLGWYTDPEGGEQVSLDRVYAQSSVIYAHYKAAPGPAPTDTPSHSPTPRPTTAPTTAPAAMLTAAPAAANAIPATADGFSVFL